MLTPRGLARTAIAVAGCSRTGYNEARVACEATSFWQAQRRADEGS
jgi:hypothetical protein